MLQPDAINLGPHINDTYLPVLQRCRYAKCCNH
jgi:hypothetical protein